MAEKNLNPQPEKWVDPVVEAYKKDVDRALLRENLKLSVEQRIQKLESMMRFVEEAQMAIRIAKGQR